jgi:hypothetical protein
MMQSECRLAAQPQEAAMLAPVRAMFEPYVERLNWKAQRGCKAVCSYKV